jgi:hypothetical protein
LEGVFAGQKTQSAKVTGSGTISVMTTTYQVDPNTGWWTLIQTFTDVPFTIDLAWTPRDPSYHGMSHTFQRLADGSFMISRSIGDATEALTSGTLLFGGEDFTNTVQLIGAALNDTKSGSVTIIHSK